MTREKLRPFIPIALIVFSTFVAFDDVHLRAQKNDLDDLLNSPKKPAAKSAQPDGLDDLLEGKSAGTKLRLVSIFAPEKQLAERLFWHTFQGTVAAETVPAELKVGEQIITAAQLDPESEEVGPLAQLKPTTGAVKLSGREAALTPGKILLKPQAGLVAASHPAIRLDTKANEIQIACAPVRFEFVDSAGRFVGTPLQIACEGSQLLRKNHRFTRLTIWLPVGLNYASTCGSFSLAAEGTIKPLGATPVGVTRTDGGFRKQVLDDSPRAQPQPPTDIHVLKNDPVYPIFVSNRLQPGEPIWIAVSKNVYQASTGEVPKPAHFTLRFGQKTLPKVLESTPPSSLDLVQRAAAGLNAKPDQLAWFFVPWPSELGSSRVSIGAKHGGHLQHHVLVSSPAKGIFLVPHRMRTVFTEDEQAVYHVIVPSGFPGGVADVAVEDHVRTVARGKIDLPPVTQSAFDSRTFELHTKTLPTGDYQLRVSFVDRQSQAVKLHIVPWRERSPFFVHCMNWGGNWPESEEGLAALHHAGVQMVIQGQQLDAVVPQIDAAWQTILNRPEAGPAELGLVRTRNDFLLEQLLRHQIRHVDFAVTRANEFYNEGLSYHHSYQPSVDRVFRRMQIFTQQTVDYPSAAGVNYSWFPQMHGYVEAGVPTDAHAAERNRVLGENLASAGFQSLSKDDRQWLQKNSSSTAPADQLKLRDLLDRSEQYWKASHEFAFDRHNEIYNRAVREVKPDAVTMLYENAGHDGHKRSASLFHDMTAAGYFTMTDFGDWPMSGAFTTDWARAVTRDQPVWLTTEGLNTTEGQTKQLFHAFARGVAGGGLVMPEGKPVAELNRRGQVLRFLSQYGAIAKHARPDRRLALLATNAKRLFTGHGSFEFHAAVNHLTRLGFPPAIVAEDEVSEKGVPSETKVLTLLNVEHPLSDTVLFAIRKFQKDGGRVLVFGPAVPQLENTIAADPRAKILSVWKGPGFKWDAHAWLWEQFGELRDKLAATMKSVQLEPLASTDPARAYALTLDGEGVRYVVVIGDRQGTHVSQFEREAALPMSLAGTGWKVRDLRSQQDLETKTTGDRTTVSVDLVTEPATILALYREAPVRFAVSHSAQPQLGNNLTFGWQLREPLTGVYEPFHGWPVRFELLGPDGQQRGEWNSYIGARDSVPLAALDQPGAWTLVGQELIRGVTTTSQFNVTPTSQPPQIVKSVGPVQVVDERHLNSFLQRRGERLVLLEPGQESLRPVAEKLVAELKQKNVASRLWMLQPEDFDTQPNRWFMRPEDEQRQAKIDAGKLIGHRQQMQPFIDKLKAVHLPEKGGFATVAPDFLVGQDAIVFSGGKLAESLRAVTAWMDSPNVPGRGEGRLVVVFSPFAANKQVVAVVANDVHGFAAAAETLAARSGEVGRTANPPAQAQRIEVVASTFKLATGKSELRPVPRPLTTLTPHRRVKAIAANARGAAAVQLEDGGGVAIVDEKGNVTAAVNDAELLVRFDDAAQLWDLQESRRENEYSATLRCIGPDGKLRFSLPAFSGQLTAPGANAGFTASSDGKTVALGQGGKVLLGLPLTAAWNVYDDTPHAQERFAVFYPRMPIAAEFSPDGRFLCLSLDTRPPLNNMSGPLFQPTFAETVLIDTQSGRRVWSLRDRTPQRSTYAAHRGFMAVARDARRVALADYDGGLFVIDETGKELFARRAEKVDRVQSSRLNPIDGVGVSIADAGQLALFAFKNRLVIVSDIPQSENKSPPVQIAEVTLPGVASACVARGGSHVVVATDDGELVALEPNGSIRWRKETGAAGMLVAASKDDHVFVGTGDGELWLVDARGEIARRSKVFQAAKGIAKSAICTDETKTLPEPKIYSPPETLTIARNRLKAKQVAAWKPTGPEHESFGKKFFTVNEPLTLAASDAGEQFVHLVYRRPASNTSLVVTTKGTTGSESFDMNLETPTYRVVDLPLRGPQAQVTITPTGPIEIAEFQLWSFAWPSANLALVKSGGPAGKVAQGGTADDLLADLAVTGAGDDISGKVKDCKIWWPNVDPDRTKGRFLPAPLDPLTMVDGQRFSGGKLQPWASGRSAFWGGSLTVDFGKPVPVSLVATYDRTKKQSELNRSLMIFNGPIKGEHDSPPTLAATDENDQFWRLFDFLNTKVQVLGVHVFAGQNACGLSEVEAYR